MENNKNEIEIKENEIRNKIKENYKNIGKLMCNELDLVSMHNGLSGHCREDYWMKFFRKIIPQKFAMEKSVMIIDSYGNISNEVDIAVFDNQYTPYVFNYGSLKFIPIEAVSVVIECKSKSWDNTSVNNWSKHIKDLKSVATGITRIVSGNSIGLTNLTQTSTTPITILASMNLKKTDNTFKAVEESFDFILYYGDVEPDIEDEKTKDKKVKAKTDKSDEKKNKQTELKLDIPNIDKKLGWWTRKLNKHDEETHENLNLSIPSYTDLEDKAKSIEYLNIDYIVGKENKADKENEKRRKENDKMIISNTLKDLEIENNPLLSLNFQLNQLLMLINNPMLFPHFAYANFFKGDTTD